MEVEVSGRPSSQETEKSKEIVPQQKEETVREVNLTSVCTYAVGLMFGGCSCRL